MKRAATAIFFALLALAIVSELVTVLARSKARAGALAAATARLDAATESIGLLPPPGNGEPSARRVDAPPIGGVAQDGRGYSLESMRGAPVLLVILRPRGTEERHGYVQERGFRQTRFVKPLIEEWKKAHVGLGPRGLDVLGASREAAAEVADFAHIYHVGFPIIGDLDARYQVAYRLTEGHLPRAFLIDKRGSIMLGKEARPGPPPLYSPLYATPYERHFFVGFIEEVIQALAERYVEFRHLSPKRLGPATVGGLMGATQADDPFVAVARAALPEARAFAIGSPSGRARSLFVARDGAGDPVGWVRPIEVDGPAGEPVQVLLALDADRRLRAAALLDGPKELAPYLDALGGARPDADRPDPATLLPAPLRATAAAIDRELGATFVMTRIARR